MQCSVVLEQISTEREKKKHTQIWSLASVRVVHKSNMEKDEEIIMLHLCGT